MIQKIGDFNICNSNSILKVLDPGTSRVSILVNSWSFLGIQVLHENVVFCVFFFFFFFFFSLSFNVYSVIQKPAILECENVLVMFNARVTVIYIGLEVHFFRDKKIYIIVNSVRAKVE